MLLLDHNISYKLSEDEEIQQTFPGIQHVYLLNLHDKNDEAIWEYALQHELIIVSKDNDFQQLFTERGYPPAVVKLDLGNCSNDYMKSILLQNAETIKGASENFGLLIIED